MNQHTAKFNILIREMSAAIENEVGPQAIRRFIPYIQMHEFESLLFSEAYAFASAIGCPSLANVFHSIRSSFRSPEEINDSPDSAPSKRIEEMFPEFQKPIHGTFGAIEIGIEKIRSQCQLFSEWLAKIEKLTVPT